MNSFRSPVYLTVGADATGVFCRDSGLVQDGLSLPIALAALSDLTSENYLLRDNFRIPDHP